MSPHYPDYYRPLNGYVLIQREPAPKQTASGIHLAGVAYGKVVAASSHRTEMGVQIKSALNVGDRVMLSPHTGLEIPGPHDSKLVAVREVEIIAVCEDYPDLGSARDDTRTP